MLVQCIYIHLVRLRYIVLCFIVHLRFPDVYYSQPMEFRQYVYWLWLCCVGPYIYKVKRGGGGVCCYLV
jgi:hypothetical protein